MSRFATLSLEAPAAPQPAVTPRSSSRDEVLSLVDILSPPEQAALARFARFLAIERESHRTSAASVSAIVLDGDNVLVRGGGEITIDQDIHLVRCRGSIVKIPPNQYRLLLFLAHSRGGIVSHERLMREMWPHLPADSRVLSQCILGLRARLEVSRHDPQLILNHHGEGYSLRP